MRINLNRHELLLCEFFGVMRRKNAMTHNADRQYSDRNPYDIDIDGFMGEFIVAKFLNLCPDFSLNEKKNPVDLKTHNGKTIDVKTTRNKNKPLMITEYHKKNPCDFYIYLLCDDLGADILGWIDKDNFFKEATLKTTKNYNSYAYEKELKNIKIFDKT
jgi:hypothetical protein